MYSVSLSLTVQVLGIERFARATFSSSVKTIQLSFINCSTFSARAVRSRGRPLTSLMRSEWVSVIYALIWYAFYDLQSGNRVGPILTAPEPTRGSRMRKCITECQCEIISSIHNRQAHRGRLPWACLYRTLHSVTSQANTSTHTHILVWS